MQYLLALKVRKVKDIFTNGYNKKVMKLHQANHDIQINIDQYACAQYVCGYLTKNEGGISKLLRAVNEECVNESQQESIFHTSIHQYYENRPEKSNEINVIYDAE